MHKESKEGLIKTGQTECTVTTIITGHTYAESVFSNNGNKVHYTVTNDEHFIEKIIFGNLFPSVVDMLVEAVNNRTKERDYFRLNSALLSEEISEEEFDKEIETHPEKYILEGHIRPTKEEIKLALMLSKNINDISNSEDLASLFSFNSHEVDKMLVEM